MINLEGKIALVTGAGSGIGRASAIAFGASGATTIVSDIDERAGSETVEMIAAKGGNATLVACDVSSADSVARMMEIIVSRFGRLDCAHNNAGVESSIANIADATEADWDRTISINLKGVWLCMRGELALMARQGSGAIVNTSSVGGLTGVPGNAAYSAAKHGVIGLTKSAALEHAAQGIRINAVCPGFTETAMTDRLVAAAPDLMNSILPPMKRVAKPSEIAGTVVFLCSDSASFLTGQAIAVDGAATAA